MNQRDQQLRELFIVEIHVDQPKANEQRLFIQTLLYEGTSHITCVLVETHWQGEEWESFIGGFRYVPSGSG